MSTQVNRQQRLDEFYDYQETYTPNYIEFTETTPQAEKMRELLFFSKISLLGVVTVLTSFVLLVLGLTPLLALPLATLVGFGTATVIFRLIQLFQEG